ncbi:MULTISPECIES: toll/interleukin-1 receptor domain-containing protein [unclassified Pseudofrankia]|uniref:toll/interleukin-1 receptor domain-containing protein n=1 Tax=unclassified Pseudofrankia TaxID=2994372 RepID=UPI0008DA8856|nr:MULTISPECIES: toll/interleukin-1 receptor domain-containing protein [unclassified Pseudofrankia]MDT3440706.1 toll/interleukin-1 receptor domain-containing protein [Pseudofrankia sp. BMG5.37]OHV58911.1 hypothetical protein BCD48_05715 [Pseudofrankia sp. BMG5.36]
MAAEVDEARWDFFVSYTRVDEAWAEWIAWTLEAAGYRVLIQAWDLVPGTNWLVGLMEAVTQSVRTVAVLSEAYTQSAFGSAEWQAAWKADPTGARRTLLVARVEECRRPGVLGQVVSFDLFGMAPDKARADLLKFAELAVSGARAKPVSPPPFPESSQAGPAGPAVSAGITPSSDPREDSPAAGGNQIGAVFAPGGTAVGVNYGQIIQQRDGPRADGQPTLLRTRADAAAPPGSEAWTGGSELPVGARRYLLHAPVEAVMAPDGAWILRGAVAEEIEPSPRRVWIRQLHVRRDSPAARAVRAGLTAQASLLDALGGESGLPRLLGELTRESGGRLTLVSTVAHAPTWRTVHRGAAGQATARLATDRIAAAAMLGQAVELAGILAVLHRRGQAHGALSADTVLVTDRRRRALPRDLGYAGFGLPATGAALGTELRSTREARALDVRQVATLVRDTLLGAPRTGMSIPEPPGASPLLRSPTDDPVRTRPGALHDPIAFLPAPAPPSRPVDERAEVNPDEVPDGELAALLDRAMHPDPARRPTALDLASGLRAARRRLSARDAP